MNAISYIKKNKIKQKGTENKKLLVYLKIATQILFGIMYRLFMF